VVHLAALPLHQIRWPSRVTKTKHGPLPTHAREEQMARTKQTARLSTPGAKGYYTMEEVEAGATPVTEEDVASAFMAARVANTQEASECVTYTGGDEWSGHGTVTYADGDMFVGEWREGEYWNGIANGKIEYKLGKASVVVHQPAGTQEEVQCEAGVDDAELVQILASTPAPSAKRQGATACILHEPPKKYYAKRTGPLPYRRGDRWTGPRMAIRTEPFAGPPDEQTAKRPPAGQDGISFADGGGVVCMPVDDATVVVEDPDHADGGDLSDTEEDTPIMLAHKKRKEKVLADVIPAKRKETDIHPPNSSPQEKEKDACPPPKRGKREKPPCGTPFVVAGTFCCLPKGHLGVCGDPHMSNYGCARA
jgi:hypothetical protein